MMTGKKDYVTYDIDEGLMRAYTYQRFWLKKSKRYLILGDGVMKIPRLLVFIGMLEL